MNTQQALTQQAPAAQSPRVETPAVMRPEMPARSQASTARANQQTPRRPYPAAERYPKAPEPQPERQTASRVAKPVQPSPVPSAPTPATLNQGDLQRGWRQVVDTLLSRFPQHGSLLMNSTIISDDGQHLMVSLPKGSGFAFRMLERRDVRSNLDPVVQQFFGNRKAIFVEGGAVRPAQQSHSPEPSGATRAAQPATTQPQQTYSTSTATQTGPSTSTVFPQKAAEAPQQPGEFSRQVIETQNAASPNAAQQPPAANATSESAPRTPATHATQASYERQDSATPAGQSASNPAAIQNQTFEPAQAQKPAPTTTDYIAPWDPEPYDDSYVPYDDFDATPYEEDYLFGAPESAPAGTTVTSAREHPEAFSSQVASMQDRSQQVAWSQRENPQQANAFAGLNVIEQTWVPTTTGQPQSADFQQQANGFQQQTHQTPTEKDQSVASTSQFASAESPHAPSLSIGDSKQHEVSDQQTQDQSTQDQQAEPQSEKPMDQPAEPATQEPVSEPDAAKSVPKPKRTRKAAGIPADLVALMTEVFGEGVNYISEPPAEEEEVEIEAEPDSSDYGLDDGTYADEPVDDADYDDED